MQQPNDNSNELLAVLAASELHYDESPLFGAGIDQLALPAFEHYHQR
ncbi:hypothetical protein [Candidatus Viridilinea mediisalina]|nr:hypothetical protein [Candidatus Viridilinea mediisalina]